MKNAKNPGQNKPAQKENNKPQQNPGQNKPGQAPAPKKPGQK